jgi:Protein of unknown function (DUF1538)
VTASIASTGAETLRDTLPIVAVLAFFQFVVLRRPLVHPRRIALGFAYVVAGLTLFVVGLEEALFPLGRSMAEQLTDPGFLGVAEGATVDWWRYYWVFLFAAAIGFATTIAEPALIAVALKAEEVSAGTLRAWPLRLAVAVGVGAAVAVGSLRIVTGTPIFVFMIAGYALVVVQTVFAPRTIIPLAYDSGGVTTSTVTVPLVSALGLGLASTVPGRSELVDGFGLIALASLFPVITVLGYAQLSQLFADRATRARRNAR